MTSEDTETELSDSQKDAISKLWEELGNPTNNDGSPKKDPRPTIEQDRIHALIENEKDYQERCRKLKEARVSLKARIKANDALPSDERTLEVTRATYDMEKASYLVFCELRKPEPFYGETIIEIDVPSGKLVIADSLYPIFVPAAVGDYNYGRGQHETALGYAEECKVASASVGNSCPSLVQKEDGSYLVVSFNDDDEDEENETPTYNDDEKFIANVITDSWSVELTDYQNWCDHGGKKMKVGRHHGYNVIKVTKGKYRWTVKSHADGWSHYDFKRAEFATLELIEAY